MTLGDPGILAGLDVLLVEDESLVALLMEDMLRELGASTILCAARVTTGLSLLSVNKPALGVLDVNVAGEVVYPIALQMLERGIPFIFVTGYDAKAMDPRFADCPKLRKPLTLDILEGALRKLLSRR